MSTANNTIEIDRSVGDFYFDIKSARDAGTGLTERTIDYIVDAKEEPDWIREFRKNAFQIFKDKPLPTHWASHELDAIDSDKILYYLASGEAPKRVDYEGGLVLGVEADHAYSSERIALNPGDRIVIFSDGVIEQHSPDGAAYGFVSVLAALNGTETEAEDVQVLLDGIQSFAQSDDLSDDVTIASLRFDG